MTIETNKTNIRRYYVDVHNGKMSEHWDVVDVLSLLRQLGIISQP